MFCRRFFRHRRPDKKIKLLLFFRSSSSVKWFSNLPYNCCGIIRTINCVLKKQWLRLCVFVRVLVRFVSSSTAFEGTYALKLPINQFQTALSNLNHKLNFHIFQNVENDSFTGHHSDAIIHHLIHHSAALQSSHLHVYSLITWIAC